MKKAYLLVAIWFAFVLTASAQQPMIRVEGPWVRPHPMEEGAGAAYMVLRNDGDAPDALIGAASEVADMVELHETVKAGDMVHMQPVARVGLVALRLIMDRAVRVHKVLTVNPALGVARFGQSNKEDKVDPFAPEELRAILAAARELNLAFSVFLRVWAQSGIREGEDSALQNQDLDSVKGTVLVRRTFTRGRLGPTKTRQTRLVSFLHPVTEDTPEWRPGVTAESRRVLAELQALPVRSLEPEAFVFGIKKPWTPAYINAEWRRTLQKAKVRYRPPEQLRHTFASTLLSRGANPLYVQKQGGWRSAAVLYKVYARWIDQGEQAVEGEAEMATLGTGKAQPDATQTQPTRRPVSANTG